MKRLLLTILAAGLAAATLADDAIMQPAMKLDLAVVVNTGVAIPVDGFSVAGQPDEAALEIFAEQGYVAVIDLRLAGENRGIDEAAVIEALGMDYIMLPVSGGDGIHFANARKLDELITAANGPVLLHCGSGNRVGALLALRESLAGADDDTAIEYGKKGGLTKLEGRVRQVLKQD